MNQEDIILQKGEAAPLQGKPMQFPQLVDFMADDYERFIEMANKLSRISLDQFVGTGGNTEDSAFWLKVDLDHAYARENGFYFYNEDMGLYPMNEFLRQIDTNKTYYLGNILDYHC